RSNPAITINSVDLPEPDGPSRPTASPRPILRSMFLRIWTRALPRPRARLTPASATAAFADAEREDSCMLGFAAPWRAGCGGRSYRAATALVHSGLLIAFLFGGAAAASTSASDRPVRIVALVDSLTAGFGLPAQAAFPAKLERALKAKGY